MPDLFDPPPRQEPKMYLEDYIAHLQNLRLEHGNLLVQKWLPSKGRHNVGLPVLAYAKSVSVMGGRAHVTVPQFWQQGFDKPEDRGDAVVRV